MRIRLPLIFAVTLIASFFVVPTVAAFKAEPLPFSPLHQRGRFQTDLFTGMANYSHSIPLPKGTADLTPNVSLDYNSGAAHDISAVAGEGWQLSRDYIERDVNYTPASNSDDIFRLHFQGSVHELVYVAGDSRYHTKIESNLKIVKVGSGGSNDNGEYWVVTTPDGTEYRFGYATASEDMCWGRGFVHAWNLDLVEDVHGNKIFYTYTEEAPGSYNFSYLTKIEYNTEKARVIDFLYDTNPYAHEIHVQSCRIQETKRLTNIVVKTNNTFVKQFNVAYTTAGNTQQLLQSITETGNATASALPATTFEYKPEVKKWASESAVAEWLNYSGLDVHLAKQDQALSDVNGDGLLDIVRSEGNGTNTWSVLLNSGSSFSTSAATWIYQAGIDAKLDRTDTKLVDVTGDNLPDVIKMHNDSGNLTYKVYRNTGSSWNTTAENWVSGNSLGGANITTTDTRIVDVNGDNLADIVKSESSGSSWKVYKNTGSNWNTTNENWNAPNELLSQTNIRLMDVNGDGLPDIIKTHTNTKWEVWKNSGQGWIATAETWLDDNSLSAHLDMQQVALSDVNGDGLPDIVKSTDGGTTDTWKVLLNNGDSWATSWEEWISTSDNVDADVQTDYTRLADVNGDGLPDVIRSIVTGSNNTWKVWKNKGDSPDLLAKVTTSQGGTITFDYMPSTTVLNVGSDMISDLPFNLWIVETMTKDNGLTNTQQTSDVTTYTYGDGMYDAQDREFRGFEDVYTVEPNGAKKHYVFNQDDAKKGRLSSVTTDDSSDDPYAKTEQTWSNSSSNGVYTVNLTMEKQYTYDGSGSSPKIVETDFDYDSYGNITKASEKGDTSISTDDRFIYFEYVYNTTDWIVNTAKKTYRNASNDSTKVSETLLYYDGNTSITDTPTKGDLTKEEKWLSGGTNPITTYAYDSYGNVTSTTDANSHTTSYAFGTNDTTRTYPDSMTNAKSQTTTFLYDLGTGNLLSKTDPNSQTTSYIYDTFGRVTKEIQPYDSTTYPTVSYTYSFNGTAPESTLVSKLEVSSASATLDMYVHTDGFGRTVQTRRDAEDTSKQIVVNTFYDPTGQVKKTTVPHLDTLSTSYAAPVSGISVSQTTYDVLGRPTTITNPDSTTKTIGYDHWVLTNTNERGKVTKQYLNGFGKIIQVDEVNGASTYSTTYTYNARDDLTKITDYLGNEFDLTYDTLSRKTSQADPDMGTWTYVYDGVGNLTSQTDARSITTARTYDELNRITLVNYPTDSDNKFSYDLGKIGTLSIATDSAGTAFYTYDNRLRKTQEQRAINGTTKTTQFSYDTMNRLATTTYPDSEVVTNAFNAQGEINSVTGSASIVSNIDYNALGKITSKAFANSLTTNYTYNTTDFRLNRIQTSSLQDLNYSYDNAGNVSGVTDSVASKTQLFSYDDLDRLKTASESAGYNHAYEYNAIGNLTKFTNSGVDTDYTYGEGAAGAHALTSSGAGTPSTVSITNVIGGGSATSATSYNTASVTPTANKLYLLSVSSRTDISTSPNQPTVSGAGLTWVAVNSVVYDTAGSSRRRVTVFRALGASPSSGALTISFGGQTQTNVNWVIDQITGADTSGTNGSGAVVQSVVAKDETSTSATFAVSLAAFSNTANATYGAFASDGNDDYTAGSGFTISNEVTSGVTLSNATEFKSSNDTSVDITGSGAFSGVGGVAIEIKAGTTAGVTAATVAAGNSATSASSYNTASIAPSAGKLYLLSVTSRTDTSTNPNQPTVSGAGLTWEAVNSTVYDTAGSSRRRVTVFRALGASPSSGALTISFGGQTQTNGIWVIDQFTGVDTSGTNGSGAVVQSATNKDETGSATSLSVTLASFGSTSNATYGTFATDGNDTFTQGTGFTLFDQEASSTVLASATEWKASNDTSVDMSVAAGGGLGGIALEIKAGSSSSSSYTYDANGNMTSDGTNCYQFNEANHMDKVTECSSGDTIAEYVYDYNGNRMVKRNFANDTLHNTVTSWSDAFETKVLAAGGTETTSYYFANSELIAKKNNDGSKYYYHNDHLGSTSVLTNASGTLVEATKYDPWGEVTSGGTASKFLYTGQEADAETGLHYYNFRYYDPSIRRFTQPDDVIQNVYDPQTLNRYTYVRNNPLKYTDPTGHATALSNVGLWINDYLTPKPYIGFQFVGSSNVLGSKPNSTSVNKTSSNLTNSAQKTSITGENTNSGSLLNNSSSQNQARPIPATYVVPPHIDIRSNIKEASKHWRDPLWFKKQVASGGPWDYKKLGEDFEPFGNFHYGAVGRAAGFTETELLIAAGSYQVMQNNDRLDRNERVAASEGMPLLYYPYGDDPRDAFNVSQGFYYAGNFEK